MKRSAINGLAWVLVIAVGFSCAALLSRSKSSNRDPLKFPHSKHAAADVECLACHESIYEAKSLEGRFLPKEETCLECHEEQKTKGNCTFCHTDVKFAAPFPPKERLVRLSHEKHIERVDEDCARCHKSLPEGKAQPPLSPTMDTCLSCHNHQADYDAGKCEPCHIDLKRYPLRPVAIFSHEGNFVTRHSTVARTSAETCATCHDQTFCADCHAATVATRLSVKYPERVDREFIHRNDFLTRHTVEARQDAALCQRCHGTTFCQSCHQLQNLTPTAANPRNPHPMGWTAPGSPNFHGPAARSDIASCASCHDQGPNSNCIQCHSVGGIGGNPHPPSWLARHSTSEIAQNPMCGYCHL